MKFRTEIEVSDYKFKTDHNWAFIPLGSCFSENISNRLRIGLFNVCENPFGTSFNPVSLAAQVQRIVDGTEYTLNDLEFRNGLNFSFDHYTIFSHPTKEVCLHNINERLRTTHKLLEEKQGVLMLTLGTAHAWYHIDNETIVNNCHKIEGNAFNRILLGANEIFEILEQSIHNFIKAKPDWQVVITVSPVRHWRDGAVSSQRSKAHLLSATHRDVEHFSQVHYFPAYELMIDDLRDYRFYSQDMLHPTPQAVDYIWEKFSSAIFSNETSQLLSEIEAIWKFANHRPKFTGIDPSNVGRVNQLKRLEQLKQKNTAPNWGFLENALNRYEDSKG